MEYEELMTEVGKIKTILKKDNRLLYLKQRWDDEKEYEDFSEYLAVIKKIFLPITKNVKATKGFKIFLGMEKDFEIMVTINKNHWKIATRTKI